MILYDAQIEQSKPLTRSFLSAGDRRRAEGLKGLSGVSTGDELYTGWIKAGANPDDAALLESVVIHRGIRQELERRGLSDPSEEGQKAASLNSDVIESWGEYSTGKRALPKEAYPQA